jgi:outer membrane protein TolC
LLSDTTALLQQRLAVVDATRNLNLLMGTELESEYTFSTPMEAPATLPQLSDMQTRLDSGNTQLQLQYLNLMLMDQDLRLARSARYPALNFQSGWSNAASSFQVGDLSGDGQTINYYANFTLSFNLYGGGVVRRNIEQLELSRQITELTTADLRRSLNVELKSEYDRYRMQADLVSISSQNVADAKLNLELSEDRLNRGLINSFNFRDAQVAYRNAQYSHYVQLFQLLNAEAALRKLTGELVGR